MTAFRNGDIIKFYIDFSHYDADFTKRYSFFPIKDRKDTCMPRTEFPDEYSTIAFFDNADITNLILRAILPIMN